MVLEFDQHFIQAENQLPNPDIPEYKNIPVIDLTQFLNPDTPDESLKDLVVQIQEACTVWGFFTVINHGVPKELLEKMIAITKRFFALPAEQKLKVRRDDVNFLGYLEGENTKNVKDWKEVFDYSVRGSIVVPASSDENETRTEEATNQWPENIQDMSEVCMEYGKAVEGLAMKLLELISMSLNLPRKQLNSYFETEDSGTRIRLNYYPPCPNPNLALGVGPHKDQGALTILAEVDGVSGLDVKTKEGEWVRVNPVPGSYIINCGDIIQVWTNDKYESSEHRAAVTSTKARYSIPFFLYPAHYTEIKPLDELVSEDDPPKYNGFVFGRYFKSRRNSNFKLGIENAQISHYRRV